MRTKLTHNFRDIRSVKDLNGGGIHGGGHKLPTKIGKRRAGYSLAVRVQWGGKIAFSSGQTWAGKVVGGGLLKKLPIKAGKVKWLL